MQKNKCLEKTCNLKFLGFKILQNLRILESYNYKLYIL